MPKYSFFFSLTYLLRGWNKESCIPTCLLEWKDYKVSMKTDKERKMEGIIANETTEQMLKEDK